MDDEERHLLAGVVRSAKRRVVPVIGRDNHKILLVDLIDEVAEPIIELRQRIRVTGGIAAMTEQHVEIDEVHEDQTVALLLPKLIDLLHAVRVRLRRMRFADSFARENVADLSDADDRQ